MDVRIVALKLLVKENIWTNPIFYLAASENSHDEIQAQDLLIEIENDGCYTI